jgi:hypothetical protein
MFSAFMPFKNPVYPTIGGSTASNYMFIINKKTYLLSKLFIRIKKLLCLLLFYGVQWMNEDLRFLRCNDLLKYYYMNEYLSKWGPENGSETLVSNNR